MKKKEIVIYAGLIILVLTIIFVIMYIKKNGNSDEETIQCIADHSTLIVKTGCSRCAAQKTILGNENLDKFKIIDCAKEENIQKCIDSGVRLLPGWIINGEKYEDIYSIEELKNMTGC